MKFQVFLKCHFGFRKNMTSVDAIVIDSIQLSLVKNIQPGGCFLNLRKAFDTVNRKKLLSKLDLYGCRGIVNKLSGDYLINRL